MTISYKNKPTDFIMITVLTLRVFSTSLIKHKLTQYRDVDGIEVGGNAESIHSLARKLSSIFRRYTDELDQANINKLVVDSLDESELKLYEVVMYTYTNIKLFPVAFELVRSNSDETIMLDFDSLSEEFQYLLT